MARSPISIIGIFDNALGPYGPRFIVRNISFVQNRVGVGLGQAFGAMINGCKFTGFPNELGAPGTQDVSVGIQDFDDFGNNAFDNNTFVYLYGPIELQESFGEPKVLLGNAQIYPSGVKP